MFYLRSDSLSSQCEGESGAFVVDLQGTTCAEVRASTRSSDLLTTAFMALVNIGFLGTTAALMARLWSAEAAARAPDGVLARSLRRMSALMARAVKLQYLHVDHDRRRLRAKTAVLFAPLLFGDGERAADPDSHAKSAHSQVCAIGDRWRRNGARG